MSEIPEASVGAVPLLEACTTANVAFAPLRQTVGTFGKRWGRDVQLHATLGAQRRKKKGADPSRHPLPHMEDATLLWDTVLLVLQPPLDLRLPDIVDLPNPLYPYQIQGVEFLANAKPCALLGDEMGLGKTVQTIVALRLLFQSGRITNALVVVPTSILRQWRREFRDWAPLLRCETVYGLRERRRILWQADAHVYLSTYGTLRADSQIVNGEAGGPSRSFDVVVLDEISTIKNPQAQQSRVVKAVKRTTGWGLSGTPLENRIEDVAAIFDFLHPRLLRYDEWEHPDKARDGISPYFLRRRKQDVLSDLPPKTTREEWIDLTPTQRGAYALAFETGVVYLRELGSAITVQHVLALLQKLKQICNFDPETGGSAKVAWLREYWPQMTQGANKLLVFSQWKESGVFDICNSLGPEACIRPFTGDLSGTQRSTLAKQFCDAQDIRALALTYGAGGLGLNLQAANYVVRFDHWWNPAREEQAADRAHRIGQKQGVTVIDFWVPDTIEERIYGILEQKRDLFNRVVDALSVVEVDQTGLSEAELFGLFDLRPPARTTRTSRPSRGDLLDLSPVMFEHLVAEVFEKRGYSVLVTPLSRDAGLDLVAFRDDPLNPETIAVQCKNHRQPVGRPDAQGLIGAAADPKYRSAVLVATSGFSSECIEYASSQGKLELLDGDRLADIVEQLGIRLPTS